MKNFSDVVEEVKELNLDEKEQLSRLLERLIAEERREEIFSNYQEARNLEGSFQFTDSLASLKKKLSQPDEN
jgi:flagellar motor switch protein FliG